MLSEQKLAWLRPLPFFLIAIGALIIPTIVYFSGHHGQTIGQSRNLVEFSQHIFPLLGLYAFTLVWGQIIVGSLTPWWRKFWPRITGFHRWFGIFVLVFAALHPTFLLIGVGWTVYLARTYVSPNLVMYVWLGYFQLFLIITTVTTALLMRLTWLNRNWRKIHLLNYVVFFAAFLHSLALGHDLGSSATLRGLWYCYGLSVTLTIIIRLIHRQPTPINVTVNNRTDLGLLAEFPNQGMKLITINGTAVVIIRSGQNVWAMDNRCSHAGGPLCEGTIDGRTLTCPWHGSQFDVSTGAVLKGPATTPQHTYPVEITDGRIYLTIEPISSPHSSPSTL